MNASIDNLMLATTTARTIFREIQHLPVFDIHTHVDLKLVLDNEPASDPWTALCAGDHYVSAIIESLGAMDRETFYNPNTDPFDKWKAYAEIFPCLLGNQIRDWMKFTLAQLGVERPFSSDNARAIWDELSTTLNEERWRPVNIFKNSTIQLMSTTDNPVDSLDQIERAEPVFGKGYWIPAWRPDPLFLLKPHPIAKSPWIEWVEKLGKTVQRDVKGNLNAFCNALEERHGYFADHGCRASDYGMDVPYGHDVDDARAAGIYDKACRGEEVDDAEAADFQSYMVRFSIGLDFDRGWISQIHYGAARNQRDVASQLGGLDSGCDTVRGYGEVVDALHDLLNYFDSAGGRQHKILLYSLSKTDWEKIAGLSRIFPSVYTGVSWWYFDSVSGMLEFMRTMPDIGAGFRKTGPFVTDARNIYSLIPRTQVYRRCLSTVLGELVEFRGESIEGAVTLAAYLSETHPKQLLGI